jgi:hypothetical protein
MQWFLLRLCFLHNGFINSITGLGVGFLRILVAFVTFVFP